MTPTLSHTLDRLTSLRDGPPSDLHEFNRLVRMRRTLRDRCPPVDRWRRLAAGADEALLRDAVDAVDRIVAAFACDGGPDAPATNASDAR